MNVIYLDCFSGISGNMLLGALIDCGADIKSINEQLSAIGDLEIVTERVTKNGLMATHVTIESAREPLNSWEAMQDIIQNSGLKQYLKERIVSVLRILAEAESKVHGTALDKLHLHEVGSIDTVGDVAGSLIALELLQIDKINSSPIALGSGIVDSAHGKLPVPGPATLEILEGIPVTKGIEGFELTTPTGAALARSLVSEFSMPDMTIGNIGYGAGSHQLSHPNVLRAVTGQIYAGKPKKKTALWLIETNIDDQNPEHMQHVIHLLLENGAKDAWATNVMMKKGRFGVQLSCLTEDSEKDLLINKILEETTSFGVRIREIERKCLDRKFIEADVEGQIVKVKLGYKDGVLMSVSPEYEDCVKAAKTLNKPLKEIYFLASTQARK